MGELLGRQLQPRELAELTYDQGWRDKNLVIAVAVWLAESQGYDHAYNDNVTPLREVPANRIVREPETYALWKVIDGPTGKVLEAGQIRQVDPALNVVLSRDVGITQENISAEMIGTDLEHDLYEPETNMALAREKYEDRGFQPWVAFTSGIALNPSWWTWSVKYGRWVPTGRYPHRAMRGVGNYMGERLLRIDSPAHMLLDYYRVPDAPAKPPETAPLTAAEVGISLPLGETARLEGIDSSLSGGKS